MWLRITSVANYVIAFVVVAIGMMFIGIPLLIAGWCVVTNNKCVESQSMFGRLVTGEAFSTYSPSASPTVVTRTDWAYVRTENGREIYRWNGRLWNMKEKPSVTARVCVQGGAIGWCN